MADPQAISADALEILITRELRRAGIEPLGLQRHWLERMKSESVQYAFVLRGRLQAYDRKWSVLVECRNTAEAVERTDIDALRQRADEQKASSALLCCTNDISDEAVRRAHECRIPLLRVVDAQRAYQAAGLLQPGPLPAWVPEFTLQLVTRAKAVLLEADDPEIVLREMR